MKSRSGNPGAKRRVSGLSRFRFLAQRWQFDRPLEEIRHVIAECQNRRIVVGLGRATPALAAIVVSGTALFTSFSGLVLGSHGLLRYVLLHDGLRQQGRVD